MTLSSKAFSEINPKEANSDQLHLGLRFLLGIASDLGSKDNQEIVFGITDDRLWLLTPNSFLKALFMEYPRLIPLFEGLKQKEKETLSQKNDIYWVPSLLRQFWTDLENENLEASLMFLELAMDLLSQASTRTYFRHFLLSQFFLQRLELSSLIQENFLFQELTRTISRLLFDPVQEETGEAMSKELTALLFSDRIKKLTTLLSEYFPEKAKFLSYRSVQKASGKSRLASLFETLSLKEIGFLCRKMSLNVPQDTKPDIEAELLKGLRADVTLKELVIQVAVETLCLKEQPSLEETPIFTNDQLILTQSLLSEWKGASFPFEKRTLQNVSLKEWYSRLFRLHQMTSGQKIFDLMKDVLTRMKPEVSLSDGSALPNFHGWSRYATPIISFTVHRAYPARVGESISSKVLAEVGYSTLKMSASQKQEWERLGSKESLVLIGVAPRTQREGQTEMGKLGISWVRGCEIEHQYDESRTLLGRERDPKAGPAKGVKRSFTILLDPIQYKEDLDKSSEIYSSMSILMRLPRPFAKYHSQLAALRQISLNLPKLPPWLSEIVIGCEPTPEECTMLLENQKGPFDSFGLFGVNPPKNPSSNLKSIVPQFDRLFCSTKESREADSSLRLIQDDEGLVQNRENLRKQWTEEQAIAIGSLLSNGITIIDGPSSSGKSEITGRALVELALQRPNEKSLVVAKDLGTLASLEKLFKSVLPPEFIVRLDDDESHENSPKNLLVHLNSRRAFLLKETRRLAESIGYQISIDFTCETAAYFFEKHIQYIWSQKEKGVFPFKAFLQEEKEELYQKKIVTIFQELERLRFLELIQSPNEQKNYFIQRISKIILATSQFISENLSQIRNGSLGASSLVASSVSERELRLTPSLLIDNLFMVHSESLSEAEAAITLGLVTPTTSRLVLLGNSFWADALRTPREPLRDQQSLFGKLIHLGTPCVRLSTRFNVKPQIHSVFQKLNSKYSETSLQIPNNLVISEQNGLQVQADRPNAGFSSDVQWVQLQEAEESLLDSGLIQNKEEAEFAVYLYIYIRLIGYTSSQIAIVTSTKAQKALIKEVSRNLCGWNESIGLPETIETVEKLKKTKFDFLIFSCVKTQSQSAFGNSLTLVQVVSQVKMGLFILGNIDLERNNPLVEALHEEIRKTQKETSLSIRPKETASTGFNPKSQEAQVKSVQEIREQIAILIENESS